MYSSRMVRPGRSGTVPGLSDERLEGAPDDLALGQTAAGGMRPQTACHVAGQLHGDRNGRLGNRQRRLERPGLPDITVGLTTRDREVAGQDHGGLRHAEAANEQPVCGVQTASLLRVGRSRHET